jgi:hypothetical protein
MLVWEIVSTVTIRGKVTYGCDIQTLWLFRCFHSCVEQSTIVLAAAMGWQLRFER